MYIGGNQYLPTSKQQYAEKPVQPTYSNSPTTKKQPTQNLGYFYIESVKAGKVFDICQDNDRKGMLIIYQNYGGSNQMFGIIQYGLQVGFQSRQSGKFLTVANDSDKNGAIIIEMPANGQRNQRFKIQETSVGSQEYMIFTFSGKALDCCQDSTNNGTRIIQWDVHAKKNQKWLIKKV